MSKASIRRKTLSIRRKTMFIRQKPSTDLSLEKFYQHLGMQLAKLIKPLPISPNNITLSKIPIGTLIFYFLYSQHFISAGFAIILYKTFDKLDGALARVTKKTSLLGAWLDLLIDRIIWCTTLFGIAIAAARINQNAAPYILLALVFFLNGLFQNLTFFNKKQKSNWTAKKTILKSKFNNFKIPIAYELLFSFYYLFDQFTAFALFLEKPLLKTFNINTIFVLLIVYNFFFISACGYVIISQYVTLNKLKNLK